MRLLAVVNKAQFNPVNTRCGTHYTPTHIIQSIKLGHHNPESTGISMISLMTIEEEGAEVTWPRRFSKYSSQSFLNPTDIALQLVPDWVIGGNKLAAIQSPLRTISLSI